MLVTFESIEDKRKVLSAKSKLSGSKAFINNDMTKDQQNMHRERVKEKKTISNKTSAIQNQKGNYIQG